MSLAVITDSSVNLPAEIQGHADVYVLDIPVIIEGQPFVAVSYTHLTLPTNSLV